MHCHEILGIQENASCEEVEQAYSSKHSKIESSKDVLGAIPFSFKVRELEAAREDCIAWTKKTALSRFKERVAKAPTRQSSDIRLNEFCCGPCTFTDICCGAMNNVCGCDCLCPEVEVSCCHTVCGSQAIPIIADLGIYAYWAWSLYSKWKEKQEAEAREYRIRQAERARTENVHLEEQLGRCRSEQKNIQDKLREEETLNNSVVAHIALFAAIGTTDLQPIYDNQQRRVQAKRDELENARKRERELQEKIRSNQRTIDAGH